MHGFGLETHVQNGLMTAGYAVLFFAVFNSRFRRTMIALMIASAVSSIYNLVYDVAVFNNWAVGIALFFRMLPPFEACWLVCYRRKELRCALVGLAGAIIYSCTDPQTSKQFGVISIRSLATVSMTIVCMLTYLTHWVQPFQGTSLLLIRNLQLQTVWMTAQSLVYVTGKWSTATWERRSVVRWIYIICAVAICLTYRRMLRTQAVLGAAGQPGQERLQ